MRPPSGPAGPGKWITYPMRYATLIDPDTLAAALENDDFRVIDCRATLGDVNAGPRAYAAGHLPGAVHAHLEETLSGPIVPGVTGRHPLPDPEHLAARFSSWGIDGRTQLIAYDDGPGAFAARLWWLARWLGHRDVAVLNGGFRAWTASAYRVERTSATPRPRRFARRPPLTRVVTAAALRERVGSAVLDARAEARYRGVIEPIDKVAGHIPGAVSAPYEGNLDGAGRFLAPEALRERFSAFGAGDGNVVCYCGSGVTACHNVLAIRIAGFEEPALYPGSWSEWITDPARPVERHPRGERHT